MSEVENPITIFLTSELVLGGVIGALSFLFGVIVKHLISLREEMIKRELDLRREEKAFFMELYGHIAILTDLVNGIYRASEEGHTRIVKKDGFKLTELSDIIAIFNEKYLSYSNFMFSSRAKGYELFFPSVFADKMAIYSGQLDAVYEIHSISDEIYPSFQTKATEITKEIEKMLGVKS